MTVEENDSIHEVEQEPYQNISQEAIEALNKSVDSKENEEEAMTFRDNSTVDQD